MHAVIKVKNLGRRELDSVKQPSRSVIAVNIKMDRYRDPLVWLKFRIYETVTSGILNKETRQSSLYTHQW